MIVKKLDYRDNGSFALFDKFLKRVEQACHEGLSNLPPNRLIEWLKIKFVTQPDLNLFFVGIDEKTGEIVAHLVAWIEFEFDKQIIFIHQLKSDVNLGDIPKQFLEEISLLYPNAVFRFWTKREGFNRYLQKLGAKVQNEYKLIEFKWEA